jgi:hypothetical protein
MFNQKKESSPQVDLSGLEDIYFVTVEEGAKDQLSETNLVILPLDMTSTYARIENKENCENQPIPLDTPRSSNHSIADVERSDKDSKSTANYESWWKGYIHKFYGVDGKLPPPMQLPINILASSILGFIGILLVSATDQWFLSSITIHDYGIQMLGGAYAATAG